MVAPAASPPMVEGAVDGPDDPRGSVERGLPSPLSLCGHRLIHQGEKIGGTDDGNDDRVFTPLLITHVSSASASCGDTWPTVVEHTWTDSFALCLPRGLLGVHLLHPQTGSFGVGCTQVRHAPGQLEHLPCALEAYQQVGRRLGHEIGPTSVAVHHARLVPGGVDLELNLCHWTSRPSPLIPATRPAM